MHRQAHKYLKEYFGIRDIHFAESKKERIYINNLLCKDKKRAIYDCGVFSRREIDKMNIDPDLAWEEVYAESIKDILLEQDEQLKEATTVIPRFFICGFEGYGINLQTILKRR